MTAVWVCEDRLLKGKRAPRRDQSALDRPIDVPKALSRELPRELEIRQHTNSPKFFLHAYLDKDGQFRSSTPITHFLRSVFLPINTFIVWMGVLVGLIGSMLIGYLGSPRIAAIFLSFMFFGAWAQRRAFDYKRVYGVWRGLCPNCAQPLDIKISPGQTKAAQCSCCASHVSAKDGTFSVVPWYNQLL